MHAVPAEAGIPVDAFRSTGTSPGPAAAPPISVLKFGSSLLADLAGYRTAAAEVAAEARRGRAVLAVCSARKGVTDALGAEAGAVAGASAPPDLVARLVGTGEAASVALLALAVSALGVPVQTLDVTDLGLRTRGDPLDAEPVAVDVAGLHARLSGGRVVVAPGFVGVDASGAFTLLGRGGSDLTALFLADALDAAECRLVKDVDGLYPGDPKALGGRPFAKASWEEVIRIGGRVVQAKAARFARERRRAFRIAAPGGEGTRVGEHARGSAAAEVDR